VHKPKTKRSVSTEKGQQLLFCSCKCKQQENGREKFLFYHN